MGKIQEQLAALQDMPLVELQKLWEKHFRHPPQRIRSDFMVAEISYRLQEKAHGQLSQTIKNKLDRMAFGEQRQSQEKFTLSHGTKLVREWNDTKHAVTVCENGFEYKGKPYRSLSKIACEITGTRWSGPLFFGLKKQKGSYEKTS